MKLNMKVSRYKSEKIASKCSEGNKLTLCVCYKKDLE